MGAPKQTRSTRCRPVGIRGLTAVLILATSLGVARAEPAGSSFDAGRWVAHPDSAFAMTAGEVTVAQFRACVDAGKCEASTVNSECNYGKADRESHPVNCVSHDGATQYCAWAGARLCTEEEWLSMCRGSDARAFPYGPEFDADACNVHSNNPNEPYVERSTAPSGATASCEGGVPGVFDMAGNVGEWLDACKDDYCKFRGAGYLSNDPVEHFTGCGGVCSGNKKGLMSNVVGIRCCKDAQH